MRRGLIAVLAMLFAAALIAACGDSAEAPDATVEGLASRTVEAGAVDVKIEPRQLDAQGAIFKITLDTHSVELSTDLTESASLDVGGVAWSVSGWSGDGPGGHHREGTLAFMPGGAPAGAVRLVIKGLPELVDVTWTVAG